jgi:transcription antitermination factor NusG
LDYPWRIVRVRSSCEKKVVDHLTARSVDNYFPQIVQKSEWTDRTVIVNRPLFPGYVFVRFAPMQKVLVVSTPGVIRNGVGGEIAAAELERIRTALDQGWKLAPHEGSAEGKRVRFRRGIFSGAEGTAIEVGPDVKVVVGLSACQFFFIEAGSDDVEVVNPTNP